VSELDPYLDRLRAALDVAPRRADEICAEARAHLEGKAADLEARGLHREQAAREAMQAFGDPVRLAVSLTQANRRHRAASALRTFLALGLAFGIMAASVAFLFEIEGPHPAVRWVRAHLPFDRTLADMILLSLLSAPALVFAGAVGGRRTWWIAAAPPVLWALAYLIAGIVGGGLEAGAGAVAATLALGGGGLFALAAFVGSRAPRRGAGRTLSWTVFGGYALFLVWNALRFEVRDAVAQWAALATAGGGLCIIALMLYRDSRPGRLQVWAAGSLCAAALSPLVVLAFIAGFANHVVPRWLATWRTAALVEIGLGLAGLLAFLGRRVKVAGRLPLPAALAIPAAAVGLGLPAHSYIVAPARDEACAVTMRQLLTALSLYAADYDGRLLPDPQRPPSEEAEDALLVASYLPYTRTPDLWHCPRQPRLRSPEAGRRWHQSDHIRYAGLSNLYYRTYYYAWPERLLPPRQFRGRSLLLDLALADYHLLDSSSGEQGVPPHGRGAQSYRNYGYLDGHVESLTREVWSSRIEEEGQAGLRGTWGKPRTSAEPARPGEAR